MVLSPADDHTLDQPGLALLSPPPRVSVHASLEEALEHLRGDYARAKQAGRAQPASGCVLVEDDAAQVVGIITERDGVRWALSDQLPAAIAVANVMSSPVRTARLADFHDIMDVSSLLRRHGIRHLPIVDAAGEIEGVITHASLGQALRDSYFLRYRQVAEVMTTKVVHVQPTDPLRQAVQTMALQGISCVVVAEPMPGVDGVVTPVGILTEGDVIRRRSHADLASLQVSDLMSGPLRTIPPSADLAEARKQMQQMGVKRLVVARPTGELVGLVTQSSLMGSIDPVDLYGVMEIMQKQINQLRDKQYSLLGQKNLDLPAALAANEFRLVVQPQLDLATGQVCGGEVLIRWRSPIHGDVSPAEFIPLAEHTGFILELGDWILERACELLTVLRPTAGDGFVLSVNVSAHQIVRPGFAAQLVALLERKGAPRSMIKLELTESVLVENKEILNAVLRELRAEGIDTAIDDFGTGFASLAYLQNFEFQTLKIDQSFIKDLLSNERNQAIVRSLLHMSQGLGFNVVAEGLEDRAAMDWLHREGCQIGQGYAISRPLELDALLAFLQRHKLAPESRVATA